MTKPTKPTEPTEPVVEDVTELNLWVKKNKTEVMLNSEIATEKKAKSLGWIKK